MYHIRMYLVSAGRRTFRPWTHTSDDSYMYQLSLVVATATAVFTVYVKLVPSPEADDVAVTSSQSLMPCRDR